MGTKIAIPLLLLVFSLLVMPSQAVSVGPNVDITSSNDLNDRQQVEPSIAVHPLKPNIIVAGAQDLRLAAVGNHRWHGYYRSTDGGLTWSVSLLPGFPGDGSPEGLSSPLQNFNALSDPVLAFDRGGNVYYTGIAFNVIGFPGFVDFSSLRLFVAKYVNDGADYSSVVVFEKLDFADKPWIVVDNTGGPNDGNVYVVLSGFPPGGRGGLLTRSTDGGLTFSQPVPVSVEGGFVSGIAVDVDGDVFVSSIDFREDQRTGTFTEFIRVTRLTQGGLAPVGRSVAAENVVSLPGGLPNNGFRTFTLPQIAADSNGVYVVWDDFRTGDADVLFVRSENKGVTWSVPLRVNDAATNHQFFPSVAASSGTISVVWYDSRLDDGGTIEALDVFYAQSQDGGETFSANLRVTSVSFNPNLVRRTDPPGTGSFFIGDYIQVAAGPTSAHPIWADNRNACNNIGFFGCLDQDVFTATITY